MTRTIALALLVATSTSLAAQSKPVITPKDFGKWEQLGAARLAPRGDWAAIGISRVSEENELRIRGGPRDTTIVVTYGANPAFSADGQWIAYAIGMSPKERERLTKEKKPVKNSLEFRNLSTGQTVAVADINTFAFSPDARFISMARYAPEGKKTTEVLVQNLATGARLSFSNVGEQAWSEIGALLALTIDTDGGLGNAVQLYDAGTGTLRVLESSPGQYRALTWRAKSTDLAVLKTHVEKEFKDTAHVLLAWTSLATPEFGVVRLDPASAQGFPAAMRIADYRRPSWSRDGRVLFFGIKKREPTAEAMKKGEEKVSEVEIWHPNDVRMLRQQMSTEQTDGRRTLLTALRIAENKIVPIGTDLFETAVALEGGRYATETDIKPYAWGQKFGRDDQDVWVVDLTSGERKKVLEKVRHYYGANPSGTKLTWSDGKDF